MSIVAINLSSSILVGVNKPLDGKEGPFIDVATALTELVPTFRYQGLTAKIFDGITTIEYWFKDGLGDADFILKSPTVDVSTLDFSTADLSTADFSWFDFSLVTLDLVLTNGNSSVTNGISVLGLVITDSFGGTLYTIDQDGIYNNDTNQLFLGWRAGNTTVTGTENLVIGTSSGGALTTGNFNTILGMSAGNLITSGSNNIGIGASSLGGLTTGSHNIAIGVGGLASITTGNNSIAIGSNAGTNITIGTNNLIMGIDSAVPLTTGSNNVFIGTESCGSTSLASISNCVYIGYRSGRYGLGDNCIFIGMESAESMIGDSNIVIGKASFKNIEGDNNIVIGNLKESTTSALVSDKLMISDLLLGDFVGQSLIINPGAYTDTTTFNLDVRGTINAMTNYAVGGINGYTGTVNIDQSHIAAPPIVITIEGGIITNVT